MHYALTNFHGECYTYRFEGDDMLNNQTGVSPFSTSRGSKSPDKQSKPRSVSDMDETDKDNKKPQDSSLESSSSSSSSQSSPNRRRSYTGSGGVRDVKEYTLKVIMPYE